jgi:hypothetical protein
LISNFSRLSSTSNFSTYSQGSVTTGGPRIHHETSQGSRRISQAQKTVSLPSLTTTTALICFACNKQCSTQGALKRHQDEKCERKVDWTCPECQWNGDRLTRHYATSHADQCPKCCSIPGERVCGDCRTRLSKSYVALPRKHTWGCPYCCEYFHNFDSWIKHCNCHHHRGETWSWSMMIWSLLQQFDLSRFGQYDWNGCDWSRLGERTGLELRDDLQRLRFPRDVRRCQEYCSLQIDEVLVRYTHRLIAVGSLFTNSTVPEPHQQARTSHIPLPRAQEAASVTYDDMCFPVPSCYAERRPNAPSNIRRESPMPTLLFEALVDMPRHQNNRPDSATIPQMVRLEHADSARAPQCKPGAQLSRCTTIVTPISGDGSRNTPNVHSIESSESNEKHNGRDSNAGALQILYHQPPYAKVAEFEARSESQLPALLERCTSSEASRTVPRRRDAECQTEDASATPRQTSSMSDFIFQQYCSYPISSPMPDLTFPEYCSYPNSSPEPEA